MGLVRSVFSAFFICWLAATQAVAADLRLEEFFNGRTTATGSFRTVTGYERSFDIDLHGRWDGRTLTLREDFTYDDGETRTLTWRFTQVGWNT